MWDHKHIANDLRDLADVIEKLPEDIYVYAPVTAYAPRDDLAACRQLVQGIGGQWDKETDDHNLSYIKHFGIAKLVVFVQRAAVCERRQVGTVLEVRPKGPAVAVELEEVEVPIYEWVCPPEWGGSPQSTPLEEATK